MQARQAAIIFVMPEIRATPIRASVTNSAAGEGNFGNLNRNPALVPLATAPSCWQRLRAVGELGIASGSRSRRLLPQGASAYMLKRSDHYRHLRAARVRDPIWAPLKRHP